MATVLPSELIHIADIILRLEEDDGCGGYQALYPLSNGNEDKLNIMDNGLHRVECETMQSISPDYFENASNMTMPDGSYVQVASDGEILGWKR